MPIVACRFRGFMGEGRRNTVCFNSFDLKKIFFLSHLTAKGVCLGIRQRVSEQSYLSENDLREKTVLIEKNKIIEVCRMTPGQTLCMLTGMRN